MLLFRLPFSNEIKRIAAPEPQILHDIESLKNQRGFVMMPYDLNGQTPIMFFPSTPDDDIISLENAETVLTIPTGSTPIPCTLANSETNLIEHYNDTFTQFWNALNHNQFDKLVLSRSARYTLIITQSQLISIYLQACRKYPRMMIYLVILPNSRAWMGCTPEILVAGEKTHYRTMALAGTMNVPESVPVKSVEWSEKNRKEQEIVADYIRARITPLAEVIEEEGPYTSRAGHLVHLKTEFHFTPQVDIDVIDIVRHLHPTPAVCGIPASSANQFILDNENYDREYYSGVVGPIDSEGSTNLYVNLRCAKFGSFQMTLYAGGGLLKDSNLTDEWEETKGKMNTILSFFQEM